MSFPQSGHWDAAACSEQRVPPGDASALLAALIRGWEHDHLPRADTPDPEYAPLSLNKAYRICFGITRQHSRSFFLSSQLLPVEKRRAIRALYAFCRTTDDLVDNSSGDARRALARWVALVRASQPPPDNPVLLAWKDTATRYAISQSLVDELLAGVAMDLSVTRYETFDNLWLYCYRVASVVGLVSMQVIGYRPGAAPYAVSLGVALQLTNILRDVGEDAARGRIYLPQEDLAHFDLCDDDILNGCRDSRFQALMRFEIERAHALYEEGWLGVALLSADSQFAIGVAAETYRGILAKIVANDYDVYTRRAHLSLFEKLRLFPEVRRRLRCLPAL